MKRLFILFWIIVVSISIYGESVTINSAEASERTGILIFAMKRITGVKCYKYLYSIDRRNDVKLKQNYLDGYKYVCFNDKGCYWSDKEGVKKGDLYEYRGEKNDVHIYCWLNQYYNPFLGSYTVLSRFYYRFSSDYKRLNCSQEDFDTKYTVDHMYYIDIYELSEPPKETEAPVKMY